MIGDQGCVLGEVSVAKEIVPLAKPMFPGRDSSVI